MRRGAVFGLALLCWMVRCGHGSELRILPEYLRAGPDGDVVAADSAAAGHSRASVLAGARAGYVSLQVIASAPAPGEYSLEVKRPCRPPGGPFSRVVSRAGRGKRLRSRCADSRSDAVPVAAARAGQSHRGAEGAGFLGGRLDSRRRPCRRLLAGVSTELERRRAPASGPHPRARGFDPGGRRGRRSITIRTAARGSATSIRRRASGPAGTSTAATLSSS